MTPPKRLQMPLYFYTPFWDHVGRPQEPPQRPQEAPGGPQEASRRRPRGLQETPERPPRASCSLKAARHLFWDHFLVDFTSQLLSPKHASRIAGFSALKTIPIYHAFGLPTWLYFGSIWLPFSPHFGAPCSHVGSISAFQQPSDRGLVLGSILEASWTDFKANVSPT